MRHAIQRKKTMKICDLHTHSSFSDGSLSPAALVALAEAAGLSALALTDHNTAAGLGELMAAGKNSRVITVPGCEFSTDYGKTELHIVGLFFPERAWESITGYVKKMREAKIESNRRLISNLQAVGCDITYEDVTAITHEDGFNRAQVGLVLVQKGFAADMNDAFRRYLREECGNYTPPRRPDAFETIRFIRAAGAAAVLAHPFLNLDEAGLEAFLPRAKECGLQAMETRYSKFSPRETALAARIAETYGLLQSGGSDFHGAAKPEIRLGTGRGDLQVPFSFYEALAKETHI